MDKSIKPYPFLKDSNIEKEALKLLESFSRNMGKPIEAPIPVFDIIEFLGYDLNFTTDGYYQDKNILGGLRIAEKMVDINENLSSQEGRMNFTAAHETGHIILHAPYYITQMAGQQMEINSKDESNILCRKDGGFDGNKKEPEEWQADKFAAYLLLPTAMVKKTFFHLHNRPINVKKKGIRDIFFPKSPIKKAYSLAHKMLRTGNFENVSRMAMLNRLIGMRLVKGLPYQKSNATQ